MSMCGLLPAVDLPRDCSEFYQFCYVSASDSRVCGVSTPFQFLSECPNDWELLESLDTAKVGQYEMPQRKVASSTYCIFNIKYN